MQGHAADSLTTDTMVSAVPTRTSVRVLRVCVREREKVMGATERKRERDCNFVLRSVTHLVSQAGQAFSSRDRDNRVLESR